MYLSLQKFFNKNDTGTSEQKELAVEYIKHIYKSFLYHHCEMGFRRNAPLCLTPESIRRYSLTETDAVLVGDHLEVQNEMIRRKLQ